MGYMINGWFQRRLSRDATNYEVKLAAFKKVNESAARMIQSLEGLREIFDLSPDKLHPLDLAWHPVGVREVERELGTDVADRIAADMKAVSLDQDEVASLEWANSARFSYLSIYSRAFIHYVNEIEIASYEARMVSKTALVDQALEDFSQLVARYSAHVVERAEEGQLTAEQIEAEVSSLSDARDPVINAMRKELETTLRFP